MTIVYFWVMLASIVMFIIMMLGLVIGYAVNDEGYRPSQIIVPNWVFVTIGIIWMVSGVVAVVAFVMWVLGLVLGW